MEKLRFWVNDALVELEDVPPTTTLLRFLRDRAHLTGTKEGCAEGDCGACSVAVIEDGSFQSVCSCLVLLPMVQGKRVVTVEGLAHGEQHHVVQETVAKSLGSQCGYCTPGVTMSLFEACYRDDLDEAWKLDAQMCGNLCRCTGYRPIREAAKAVAGLRPDDAFLASMRRAEKPQMELSYRAGTQRYFMPSSFAALWDVLDRERDARIIAGGTDLALEVTKKFQELPCLVSLEAIDALRVLETTEHGVRIGAGVNLSKLESAARFSLPPLERMLRYFGSRQIKNRATVGGNLCTASPIGDLAPVFLALDATVVLASRAGERRVPIAEFFLSYRKTAMRAGEVLASVEVPRARAGARIASYKASKRRELDISAVASSFYVLAGEDGRVAEVRLAYGGMSATPARARLTEQALLGKEWSEASVVEASAALDRDFTPLSDHRGSAWYRATVAKNLLLGFFLETEKTFVPRLEHRHAATVQVR